jgi:hypothetical protein
MLREQPDFKLSSGKTITDLAQQNADSLANDCDAAAGRKIQDAILNAGG